MIILHKIDDFIFEIFPKAKAAGNDPNILAEEMKQYYLHMGG